jgi:transposase InsO family protein
VLKVISLAQFAVTYTRGWGADSINTRLRQKTELERLTATVALLREEIRIKDVRMARISPHRRPQYPPVERMAILELRAAQGWTLRQTARTFLVTEATISSWMKRIDEEDPHALVQLREPVNRFPQFVRYAVQRLKILCPTMGKVKIAQVLSRAGLHLGVTTVGRILKEAPCPRPKAVVPAKGRVVTAREPGHVWHIDLTVVPIGAGLWTTWLPFALPQCWPFCWWCAVVADHYSRRIMKLGLFSDRPNCRAICSLLGQTVRQAGAAPKYIVCDRESIFDCDAFRSWVKKQGIRPPRYGAVGKHGSIAVVERLILTVKNECTRKIAVPLRRATFRRELDWYGLWYNQHRPHMTLGGATPDEVYFRSKSAHRQPRIEPRKDWPRRSSCALPRTLVAGQPGDRFGLEIRLLGRRQHLPIVEMQRAA